MKRVVTTILAAAALLAVSASSASARHIGSELDCGDAGVFTVAGTEMLPSGFQAPQGGVHLLEGTTQRFLVFQRITVGGAVTTFAPGKVANQGGSLLVCAFTWSNETAVSAYLYGMLTPSHP